MASSDVFRVLVATDNHLGHKESDQIRGSDSFDVMEEILAVAQTLEVDFLLHGGDLFDMQKPSNQTMYKTLELFRRYCFGTGKPLSFLSASSPACRHGFNYDNPNVHVQLPVFMIHGNHDDPAGDSNLSALDILEVSHMINYFGRAENQDDICVSPLLLTKGTTKLALYGLGNVHDERLHRAFRSGKVNFVSPEGHDTADTFNIMVIHQNRYKGAAGGSPTKNCVHESMLPTFLDLVIWGHEHDSLIELQECVKTSLSPGEAMPKHIAFLEIVGDSFRSKAIPLQAVRPFVHHELVLSDYRLPSTEEKDVWKFLVDEVEKLICQADEERLSRLRAYESAFPQLYQAIQPLMAPNPRAPLIRLKVEHTGFPALSPSRFGRDFTDKVANPQEVLQLFKKAARIKRPGASTSEGPELSIDKVEGCEDAHDIIFHYIEEHAGQLALLPEPDMNMAVQHFVGKLDSNAITTFTNKTIAEASSYVKQRDAEASNTSDVLVLIKRRTDEIRAKRYDEGMEAAKTYAAVENERTRDVEQTRDGEQTRDDEETSPAEQTSPAEETSQSTRRAGGGGGGMRATTRKRGRDLDVVDMDVVDMHGIDMHGTEAARKKQPRSSTRGRGGRGGNFFSNTLSRLENSISEGSQFSLED
eukprot:GHVS01065873.1.p1 GENE.GHVS01065873.1~~GHVS01065873.1.p1  ORF type:complete len:643 (+),score=109.58 GHVS01065873.1:339-2267(+)